ncbi:MAG: zinc ribbon domain-containing protein [Firmicutes bacterium]|nr:zinc ribbon domain-containing protein [Bacillota bacterium]
MALLDFKCNDCGEKFFEIVSASEKDKIKCPKCGGKDIIQVFEGSSSFGSGSSKISSAPRRGG